MDGEERDEGSYECDDRDGSAQDQDQDYRNQDDGG